jgi:hypothetical protein
MLGALVARSTAMRGLLTALALLSAVPAMAQVELSGSWVARNHEDGMERGPGPYAVDYTGLPLNDEGRERALGYSGAQLGMIERQCGMYPPYYVALGPFGLKIWNESEPTTGNTVAWKIGAWEDRAATTIWMDGRPHPSANAPHERGGFTTGRWEGDTLVATTTHMRAGVMRRNGAPVSDQAVMTTYFFRNADLMTMLVVIEDPVYLAEPFLVSKGFQLDTAPQRPIGPPCVPGYEGQSGDVPHYLPGTNPFVDELTTLYGIPRDAVLGGTTTMYPEYRKTIRDRFVRPERCTRNCGGPPRQ